MPKNTSVTLGENFDKFVAEKFSRADFKPSVKLFVQVFAVWKQVK